MNLSGIIEAVETETTSFHDEHSRAELEHALSIGHEALIVTHPGAGLFVMTDAAELDGNIIADELNWFAQTCWHDGDWPVRNADYPAWIVRKDGRVVRVR